MSLEDVEKMFLLKTWIHVEWDLYHSLMTLSWICGLICSICSITVIVEDCGTISTIVPFQDYDIVEL